MHTLRKVEADIQQHLLDHKLSVEQRFEEALRKNEESIKLQAEDILARVNDQCTAVDSQMSRLQMNVQDNLNSCRQSTSEACTRLDAEFQSLNNEVVNIHTSLPSIRQFLSTHSEAIRRFEELAPELRSELASVREETRRQCTHLSKEVENEMRRAEGQEAANMRDMQRRIDDTSNLIRSVEASLRVQVAEAVSSMGVVETRLIHEVEVAKDFVAQRVKDEKTDNCWMAEIHETRDLMQDRLDECLSRMDVRSAAIEAQLRGEMTRSFGDIIERCEKAAEFRMAEVSLSLSEGLETARRDLRAQAEKQQTMSQKWKDEFQQAMSRLESVSAAARTAAEQIHHNSTKQISIATSQLREEIAREKMALQKAIENLRSDLDQKAAHSEMQANSNGTKVAADSANSRVAVLEANYDRLKAWLESETSGLNKQCHSASTEATDIKQRLSRENAALGSELSHMRAATTSLTHGVLRALQLLGLLDESPNNLQSHARATRWGIDVEDLVQWEKSGRSLADRISEQWSSVAPAATPTVMDLLHRKVDRGEYITTRPPTGASPTDFSKRWTPSTATGFNDGSPPPCHSADLGRGSAEGFVSPFSASSPFQWSSRLPAVVSTDLNRTF